MVKLVVTLKPNTSAHWFLEKLRGLSFNGTNPLVNSYQANCAVTTGITVEVPKEEELTYSRAIRMISPQVVSVSRA